ncbi:MAG: tRNA (adenosine(37)-N6)-dimethylallyltransferase MiaA [Chlorobi bacterium]|nr:tRNA (adenosine(37)-N6)-dimethylallyltransferase MiaA [Chlorobiota bacterium]
MFDQIRQQQIHQLASSNIPTAPPTVVVVQGPTASGKTVLAHALAEEYPIEIISADSRQVYIGLDIGTAKPTPAERQHYHYHGLDICTPDNCISAGTFAQLAWGWIEEITSKGKIPLIVGGSGLYVRAIINGFVREPAAVPESVRATLEERLHVEGRDVLYAELQRVDPESAMLYSDRNPRRILRALEFFYAHGIPISTARQTMHQLPPPMSIVSFVLLPDRKDLYSRIRLRTRQMWNAGLLTETLSLLDAGYHSTLSIFSTIGYAEALAHLENRMSLDEAIEHTEQRTRNYAKRQYTWLRNEVRGGVILHCFGENALDVIRKHLSHTLSDA